MFFSGFDKLVLIFVISVGLVLAVSAAPFDNSMPFHPLSQISADGVSSVDMDGDGVIDKAGAVLCPDGSYDEVGNCVGIGGGGTSVPACSTLDIDFGASSLGVGKVIDVPSECKDGPCELVLSVNKSNNNWSYFSTFYPGEATTGIRNWSAISEDAKRYGVIGADWNTIMGNNQFVLIGDDCPGCATGDQTATDKWTAWSYKANQSAKLISCSLNGGGGSTVSGGGAKVLSGKTRFDSGACGGNSSDFCEIDISAGNFTNPVCSVTMQNSDGTTYTENMVIGATDDPTKLKVWKGKMYNDYVYAPGETNAWTTMQLDWICVEEGLSEGGTGGTGSPLVVKTAEGRMFVNKDGSNNGSMSMYNSINLDAIDTEDNIFDMNEFDDGDRIWGVRCREENGWFVKGCALKTNFNNNVSSNYLLNHFIKDNGCFAADGIVLSGQNDPAAIFDFSLSCIKIEGGGGTSVSGTSGASLPFSFFELNGKMYSKDDSLLTDLIGVYHFDAIIDHSINDPPHALTDYATSFGDSVGNAGAIRADGIQVWGGSPFGGNSYWFDRDVNSYVTIGNNQTFDMANDLTISVWVYPVDRVNQNILEKSHSAEGELRIFDDGELVFFQGKNDSDEYDNTKYDKIESGLIVPINAWSNIVVVRDKSSKTITFYLNGTSSGPKAYANVVASSTDDLIIGGRVGLGTSAIDPFRLRYSGMIDELAIWKRVLSSDEVTSLYQEVSSISTSNFPDCNPGEYLKKKSSSEWECVTKQDLSNITKTPVNLTHLSCGKYSDTKTPFSTNTLSTCTSNGDSENWVLAAILNEIGNVNKWCIYTQIIAQTNADGFQSVEAPVNIYRNAAMFRKCINSETSQQTICSKTCAQTYLIVNGYGQPKTYDGGYAIGGNAATNYGEINCVCFDYN
jgi:hypothetical protein